MLQLVNFGQKHQTIILSNFMFHWKSQLNENYHSKTEHS
jgi:hypothetical protein